MDGKQLVRMVATIGNTYAACMEQHCLRLFIALSAYLGNLIQDGDVVNAYAHALAQGTRIYISVDDVFQAWYLQRFTTMLPLGTCIPIMKAMQGHPSAGKWWSEHFDRSCATPLHIVPAFTEPTIYRQDNANTKGPTFMLRPVDDVLVSTAAAADRAAVLSGIVKAVTFKISADIIRHRH
jgi:hypothetical protein